MKIESLWAADPDIGRAVEFYRDVVGLQVAHVTPASAASNTAPPTFSASDLTTVYDHAVAPGRHAVTIDVDRKDDRDEAFRTSQRSRFTVDVPKDKPVAVAREFVLPAAWAVHRIILRFDAIHAGTRYWLNGRELGYSENLFTPVEWDITDAARTGQTNRLDLEMKVATVSDALSCMTTYAFHNLGGKLPEHIVNPDVIGKTRAAKPAPISACLWGILTTTATSPRGWHSAAWWNRGW